MIARILCRLGVHSWKPVYSPPIVTLLVGLTHRRYHQIACVCRRCGKRVSV